MNDREKDEFERIRLVARMEYDWERVADYRRNEKFYINRLVESSRALGQLEERLA
ncbi:hypothetical protein HH310_07695 [Actinoplanes sp. TBRC 11911]|uniref:hypothetical protein n=1 Tax=Actinoplanes sp. TBRC 11911 TaxID=2729386 RepID=UPI00145E6E98|nr:hypothetical protein [Actinoplanes sp. TBRC 11911]NMO51071.1 hypothetical protein [Actinoplanes sp. TBRC 11911]